MARLEARKARGRKAAAVAEDAIAWGEPVLASSITTVIEGRLYYRGRDAVALAETETLEAVARLLRGGDGVRLKERRADAAGPARRSRAAVRRPGRARRRRRADARTRRACAGGRGREPVGRGRRRGRRVGGRGTRSTPGWPRPGASTRSGADLIRRLLVLLADHELNASTFAARVAASTGASLAAADLAGLAALSGPLHGGMAPRVEAFIAEAERVGAEAAVAARIAQGLLIPGFGHQLYPAGDPRAAALLAAFTPPPAYEAVREAAEAMTGVQANVDMALDRPRRRARPAQGARPS